VELWYLKTQNNFLIEYNGCKDINNDVVEELKKLTNDE